jgi:hypothetical protein
MCEKWALCVRRCSALVGTSRRYCLGATGGQIPARIGHKIIKLIRGGLNPMSPIGPRVPNRPTNMEGASRVQKEKRLPVTSESVL